MLGWQIFVHAFRMVFHDPGTAVRISSPIIVVSLFQILLYFVVGAEFITGEQGDFGGVVALAILNYVAALWVAVSWHRYCLLEEYPEGAMPSFDGSRILAYFWWALLLGLLAAVMFGLAVGMGLLLGWPLGAAVMVIGFICMIWIIQRLSLVLPASAVNNKMTLGDAWRVTGPIAGTILLTLAIFLAFAFAVGFVSGLVGVFSTTLEILVNAVVQWIVTMMALSILTTLYGVCAEKRDLT